MARYNDPPGPGDQEFSVPPGDVCICCGEHLSDDSSPDTPQDIGFCDGECLIRYIFTARTPADQIRALHALSPSDWMIFNGALEAMIEKARKQP